MKVKLNGQKIIASVVVAAMSIAFIPKITGSGNVLAATTKNADNTCLCTTAIQKPDQPGSKDDKWSGSYVYFGTYGGNPIKFRVLAPSTNVYGSSTLFLNSDEVLFEDCFDKTPDSNGDYTSSWADSSICDMLNGTFLTGFTSLEQGAIAKSTGTGGLTYDSFLTSYGTSSVSVSDQVFILDASEVMNPAYGYSTDSGWEDDDQDGDWSTGTWTQHEVANRVESSPNVYSYWLRSALVRDARCALVVQYDGILCNDDVTTTKGVAPALNVDRSKIIFSTAVEGKYGQVGASYKLTIFDDSLSITAGEASVSGTKVSIGNTVSGGPSQISVLILDKEYTDGNTNDAKIKYYGALSEEQSFDFSSTGLDLAGWGKDYYVYILAEKISDSDYKTDYATKPVAVAAPGSAAGTTYTVSLNVDTVDKDGNPITATGGTATVSKDSGVTGDKITVTATPNEGYQLKSIEWGNGATATDITTAKEFTIENFNVAVDVTFEEVSSSSSSGTSTGSTSDPATGTTMDPSAPTYTVIKGADATANGSSDLVIEVKRSEDDEHCLDYFDWVAVDGTKLTSEQAPTSSGSTIITIKAEYLKTLSEGKHTIVVNFVDNSVSTTITIQAAQKSGTAVPSTGELQSPAMYLGIALIVAACGVTGFVVMKKRKEA